MIIKKKNSEGNKTDKKIKKEQIITIAMFSLIAIAFIIILFGMSFYKYKISEVRIGDTTSYSNYKYHYAMISMEADDPFWEDLYQGALEAGKEQEAYVEKIGSNLSISYSLYDLMQIAIASNVNGIIVEPNGEEKITELIDKAESQGITVITVLKDAPESKRKSFVGINSYNEGQSYGKQVLELVNKGKSKVTVLLHENSKDTTQNLVYSTIRETVDSETKNKKTVDIEAATVNTQNTFGSEEDIRNIIMDTKNPPDILVCLTAVDTICAYQAIVDYNKVGEIEVIGYYDSDFILSAIDKEIIYSSMTVNAKQMGEYCIDALTEYRETQRVSDYYSVDISVINAENVQDYIDIRNEETVE